ncbi:MAG: hypothetical protein K2Y37_21440 [Pirellulales bacterium]|nr:hypothetical protein [Pirellulales bacterium]
MDARPILLPLLVDRVPAGLRHVLVQEGIPFVDRMARGSAGRFVLFDSRQGACRNLAADQVAIDVDQLRRGAAGDPFEDLLDERSTRTRWSIDGRDLVDVVSRVDKREVRRRLMARLRELLEQRGGVWFRIGAVPFPYRSALNFRIDHHGYDAADFDALLGALLGFETATSHFVGGVALADQPEAMARLRGMDVGSSGYLPHLYQDPDENLRNLRRGVEALRRFGIEPQGFAAAGGRFNRGLLAALDTLGISHLSGFGMAYDELPMPLEGSRVLYLPTHPLTLGSFLEAAARDGEASGASDSWNGLIFDSPSSERPSDSSLLRRERLADRAWDRAAGRVAHLDPRLTDEVVARASAYFQAVVQTKYQAGEPILLCGQVLGRLGRYPQFLRDLLAACGDFGALWRVSLTELDRWWRDRATARVRVVQGEDRYEVQVEQRPPGYRLAGELWRGAHVAQVPLDESIVPLVVSALAFQGRRPRELPKALRVDQPQAFQGPKLPRARAGRASEASSVSSWRGWMDRTWRRKKD